MYSDKGKGKGKRSDSAYLDYCVSRVDPDDQGALDPRLLPLSRMLAQRLRYKDPFLRRMGVAIDEEGWADLAQVLSLDDFLGFNAQDVRQVVKESYSKDRPRFETKTEGGRLYIRAAHKRPERGYRGRRPSPGPPTLEDVPFVANPSGKKNKMGGGSPQYFDIGKEEEAAKNFSSLGVEWSRLELKEGLFGWWAFREGTEEGFAELAPDPWMFIGAGEVEELEHPCWYNTESTEYFFVSPEDLPQELT
ncbi:unnamed protein product [Effrenium voratum]|nr:unnamed protein product [Effrenium voratum]